MDFRNNSIPADKVTSYDVNKAVQRSLTKAVARHGLGLYIYAGEDLPEGEEKPQERQTEKPKPAAPAEITCTKCGVKIEPVIAKTGKTMTAQEISDFSRKKFGQCLCPACQKIENERAKA